MTEEPLQKISGQVYATRSSYSLEDFIYDKKLNIYISPSGIGAIHEEYPQDPIRRVKGLTFFDDLTEKMKKWQSGGLPEHLRNNIFEGVAELFKKNSHVLEIGTDQGTGTRWLGERSGQVDAIEGDLQKAVAARTSATGMDNVKVYFGDVLKTSFHQNYDRITMTDVQESILFNRDRGPGMLGSCIRLLKRLNRSLNDRGILALAIENKPGAGHISEPLEGPARVGRNELEVLLKESGFNNIRFYHLFPDRQRTRTMIAECDEVLALRPYNWIKTPVKSHEYSIPEPVFLKAATESGLLWQLSNSFLVLAARSDSVNPDTGWLIKKLNNESYDKKFHHSITLEKNGPSGYVIKRAPILDSKPFFNVQDVEYWLESMEYVDGELLSFSLYNGLLEKDRMPAVERAVRTLYDSLMSTYETGKKDTEGYPLVSGDAIDYTFWNLVYREDGGLFFIDRKWKIKKDIPADLVLFRNLFYSYLTVLPFLDDKSRLNFIIRNIRRIYPNYSLNRLRYDVGLEEKFQSAICDRESLHWHGRKCDRSAVRYLSKAQGFSGEISAAGERLVPVGKHRPEKYHKRYMHLLIKV